tara:strand:+ start:75 stop:1106 length:1032 start_codon:yes stop_codon:yes gene_type:complete
MSKKTHYFIFVFKYRFRKTAFNNFLNIRQIKNFKIIDLSGPFKYYLFSKLLILIINSSSNLFRNVTLISCDGLPFLEKKSVNIWFGGTKHKIPRKFRHHKNNIPVIKSPFIKEKNWVSLYPCLLKNNFLNKKFKIVFVGRLNLSNSSEIKLIWKKYNKIIINNFSIIENKNFLKKVGAEDAEHEKLIYMGLKAEIRLNIIRMINRKFKSDLIVVGSDWKNYIKNFIDDNHDVEFVRNMYSGNLCLDLGSKWGNNTLYPRSIEIIESSGILLQSKQSDSKLIFGNLSKLITFNSFHNLSDIIIRYKKDYNLLNSNQKKIHSLFKNNNMNYETLKKFKKIGNQLK